LAVTSTYTGAKTVVRTVYGNGKCFEYSKQIQTFASKNLSISINSSLSHWHCPELA